MPGFPTECLECPHLDETDYTRCYECAKHRIHSLPGNCCPKCSHPLVDDHCTSHGCRQGLNRFSKVYAVGQLTGLLSGGISRLKDAREKRMAAPLGKLLAGYMLEQKETFAAYDFFLPIPKHPDRIAARGFDQVKAIYREACRYLVGHVRYDDLQISPYLIQNKVVKSLRRDTHSAAERFQEVDACFSLSFNTRVFEGMRLLVFDDVMTSGATMSAAAQALCTAGAASVDGIVLGRKLLDTPGSDARHAYAVKGELA